MRAILPSNARERTVRRLEENFAGKAASDLVALFAAWGGIPLY
jgi:hypothetical protein